MENESAGDMLQRLGIDGKLWVKEFSECATKLGYSKMDEDWLHGWFANAIMAGYDWNKGPLNGDHAQYLIDKNK
jgi:hypothetical protein